MINKKGTSVISRVFFKAATVFIGLMLPLMMIAPNVASAQIPFGGMVYFSIYCPCSANFFLYVSPPTPAYLMYSPGISRQYPYFRLPQTGVWTLGLYSPGGICLMYAVVGCFSFGAPQGTIMFSGTSM